MTAITSFPGAISHFLGDRDVQRHRLDSLQHQITELRLAVTEEVTGE